MRNDTKQVRRGSDLMVFVYDETAKKYKSIAFATSHSFTLNAETTEISSKDGSGKWADSQINQMSWEMSTENLFAAEGAGYVYDDLMDLMLKREKFEVVFTLENDSVDIVNGAKLDEVPDGGWAVTGTGKHKFPYYKGNVVITSLEVNAPNAENATFSASFTGVGPLRRFNANGVDETTVAATATTSENGTTAKTNTSAKA